MADSNVDFENKANLEEEGPPPILSPEIREVFHQFANMLDIKSFMRLSMASKGMYEHCMKDKMIKIGIEEDVLVAMVPNKAPLLALHSSVVSYKNTEQYLKKLRQLNCNVSLEKIVIHGGDMNAGIVTEIRLYLEDTGVKSIKKIRIDMNKVNCWPQIVSFIKDFHLEIVEFCCTLPEDVLRSFFQWNLKHLFYDRTVPGELLLEMDTSIPEIWISSIRASTDVFTQILWKIQIGAFKKLSESIYSVKWDNFTSVSSDFDGPLPAERPLLISGGNNGKRRWFLHWDGGVTKCELEDHHVEFSKCQKDDLPPVLQSKGDVHKALAEKSKESIQCLKSHFTSFFDGISVLDAFHEGPFPDERPLLCKCEISDEELTYCVLNEDGSMDVYGWDGCSGFEGKYDLEKEWPEAHYHLPLLKFLVKKRIRNSVKKGLFECRNVKDFRMLFEDCDPLPCDFRDQLPERRPLVFASKFGSQKKNDDDDDSDDEKSDDGEDNEKDCRVVLYEDGTLVQYRFDNSFYGEVYIGPCSAWNVPSMMMTPEKLKEIVLKAPSLKTFSYGIDHDMFCDAFKGIKTLAFHSVDGLPSERPLIFKKTDVHDGEVIDQRWFVSKDGSVRKCDWENGRARFSTANPAEFPFILTKSLVTQFFEGKQVNTDSGFYIDRFTLNQCLEDCELHEYDDEDSDILSDDHPLIFMKTEIEHVCQKNGRCECMEEILHLCFVNDNEDVIHITWDDRFLSFNKKPDPDELPSILKSTEYLTYLFEESWNSNQFSVHWYGSYEDLVRYFEDHKPIDHNQNGPLPKTRPLYFKDDSPMRQRFGVSPVFWFLRKDGVWIECEKKNSHVLLTVNPNYGHPPAISRSS